jgi:hypothetical protein
VCGGNLGDLADAPTDNKGNTYVEMVSREYNDWAGYGLKAWVCENGVGGSNHVFSQEFGQTLGFDEATIAVVEIRNGTRLQAIAVNHPNNGQALTSPSISSTGPAVWVAFWSGDAPVGQTSTISWNNGFQTLDESTLVDHPNGYVPIAVGAIPTTDYTPTARNFTVTESPDQGSINIIVAIQAAVGALSVSNSTLGALSQVASGEVRSAGASASTLGILSQVASGIVAVRGSASNALGTLTQNAQGGTPSTTGISLSTLGVLLITGQGQVLLTGTSSSSFASLTQSALGVLPISGLSVSTLGDLTCEASSSTPISGSSASTLGSLTCSARIITDLTGRADQSLGELSLTAGGGDSRLIRMSFAGETNLIDQAPNITLLEG